MLSPEFDFQSLSRQGLAEDVALRFIIHEVPNERPVVDLGCGDNSQIAEFMKRGYWGFGIDNSETLIINPKLRAKEHFIVADITRLPFKNESLGAITGNAILDYFDEEGLRQLAAEIERTLASGGLVYLSDQYGDIDGEFALLRGELQKEGFREERDFLRK